MNAVDKIRNIVNWLDFQSEYANEQFTTIKQLEQVYDYTQEKGIEFIDEDYLYRELTDEERKEYYKFIKKIKK